MARNSLIVDIDSPLGAKLNRSGRRRPCPDTEDHDRTEDLADVVFMGEELHFLEERTKEQLIDLINDMSSYMATLHREYYIAAVHKDTLRTLRVSSSRATDRLRVNAAAIAVRYKEYENDT